MSASECLPLELWLQSVTEGETFVNSVKKGTSLIEEMDLTEPCSACISSVAVAFNKYNPIEMYTECKNVVLINKLYTFVKGLNPGVISKG